MSESLKDAALVGENKGEKSGLLSEHEKISKMRKLRAKELASGDAVLEDILFRHMNYKNSARLEPKRRNGIVFYGVGENATNDFHVGVEEGRIFTFSSYIEFSEENGEQKRAEGPIREINNLDEEYLGHYLKFIRILWSFHASQANQKTSRVNLKP